MWRSRCSFYRSIGVASVDRVVAFGMVYGVRWIWRLVQVANRIVTGMTQ